MSKLPVADRIGTAVITQKGGETLEQSYPTTYNAYNIICIAAFIETVSQDPLQS